MITGRKKKTIPSMDRIVRHAGVNSSITEKNLLPNDLGGVIFGCTRYTMEECLSNQIFGLPAFHIAYIKNIKPGLPLFLFNYSDRKMHGIYEAASDGEMNINPYGWSENGQEFTKYPAQVRICIRKQCKPLLENQYKPIIIDNYYTEGHFWFELDHSQTGRLIWLFESSPIAVPVYPQAAPKQKLASKPSKKVECEDSWETASDSTVTKLNQHEVAIEPPAKLPQYKSKWNVLQDMNSASDEYEEEAPSFYDSEDDTRDLQTSFEFGSSSPTPCDDENNQNLELDYSKVQEEYVEELVYGKLSQMVNEREKENCDSVGDEENIGVSYDLTTPADFNCEPELPIFNSEKHEVVSTNSSDARLVNNQNFQPDLNNAEEENEEELVYCKLLQLVNERKKENCDSVGDEGNVGASYDLTSSADFNFEPEVPIFNSKNHEVVSTNSSDARLENNHSLEPDLDKVEEENEEGLVYRKLLQLVNEREKKNCDSVGDEENVGASYDLTSPADFNCEPEAPIYNSEKHEVLSTNATNTHFVSRTSSGVRSILDELRKEVYEVKVQQLQMTSQLEMKLTKAEVQVQQLAECITKLESQLSQSIASVKSLKTGYADTMDMEEFLGNNKLVFLFGGYDGASWLSTVDCYSPLSDTKKSLGPMNIARSYAAAAALCGDIYVLGGGDGKLWFNTVESYNPQRNEWTPRPSLAHKKGCLSGVTLGNKIFAIGGGDGVNCFSDVEMFDPAVGKWIPTQSMHQKRFSSAAAELNGAIYAVGGFDGENYLNSVERFDPREVVSWSSIPSMNIRRGCHSLVAMNEKLYVLGGYNGENMVSSVEVFDPRKNSWIVSDEMKEARGYATAAVIDESIFVISGLKDVKMLTETVECYKEGQGWFVANFKGAGKRCFFTAISM
ncbi:ring canal kelch protein-like isoform X2 [Papaver somniferum]|nr:ring canal kelch protein-like isoform X2 [Papaver somniferum]